jgi:predicted DNA-binding ribbon-helix-helix protein
MTREAAPSLEAEAAAALAGGVAVRKRSVVLAGHRTSLSLEDAFWRAARAEAARRGVSLNALVEAIDRARGADPAKGVSGGLSAAVRVFLLKRAGVSDRGDRDAGGGPATGSAAP